MNALRRRRRSEPNTPTIETTSIDQWWWERRLLSMVAATAATTLTVNPPFIGVVWLTLANEVSRIRLMLWSIVGAVTVLLAALCVLLDRRSPRHRSPSVVADASPGSAADRHHEPLRLYTALAATHASIGVFLGLSTWVGGSGSPLNQVAFTTFPMVAAAVAVVFTAGRRDLFVVFALPMFALVLAAIFTSPHDEVRPLGWLVAVYAALSPLLHLRSSTTLRQAVALQNRSEALLMRSAKDRDDLAAANAQLFDTNAQLAHMAFYDPLTGLLNRRGALESLDEALDAHATVSLLYCDLDRFKAVNDLLGHRGGDQFLTVLAERIARSLEHNAFAGRIGGDEFIVVLPGVTQASAVAIASRIVGVLAQPVHAEGRECPSSVSVGVATAPGHGPTSSELLRHANAALFRAKAAGRNRVEVFDGEMHRRLSERLEQEQQLRRALDANEIVPFFQPEIDASTGAIVGAELLARWVRPDGRVSSAGEFIDTARSAGIIERLTEQVAAGARLEIRRLAALGLPSGFRFRLNVSADQNDRVWHDRTLDVLTQGIDPHLLTVDVREGTVSDNLIAAASALAGFRAQGGRVCIDDFGHGVSSLSTLRRLPLDEVRIDRLAMDSVTTHPHDRAVVRSIIALVRELGLLVTADGVETPMQADALIALGCIRHQGHLYAPALIADEFESFMMARLAEQVTQAATADPWDDPNR